MPEARQARDEDDRSSEVRERFETVAALLAELDVQALWEVATEDERRALIDELLDRVEVHTAT